MEKKQTESLQSIGNQYIINIAEEAEYKYQDEAYNKAYKSWRMGFESNPYAYNYVRDTREHVYLDGVGFISEEPEDVERECIKKNSAIIATSLILYFFIELFGRIIAAIVAHSFGLCTYGRLFMDITYTSANAEAMAGFAVNIAKFILCAAFLNSFIKLPREVYFPTKVINRRFFGASIPAVLIFAVLTICASGALERMYSNLPWVNTILAHTDSGMEYSLYVRIIRIFFDLIVYPVLYEIYIRGIVMQSLRQFGDGFALMMTCMISALLTHDIAEAGPTFMLALCIGYFVLKTGSLLTGTVMHIVYKAIMIIYIYLGSLAQYGTARMARTVYMIVILVIGFVIILAGLRKYRGLISMNVTETYLTARDKVSCVMSAVPVVAWLVLTFLFTVTTIGMEGI